MSHRSPFRVRLQKDSLSALVLLADAQMPHPADVYRTLVEEVEGAPAVLALGRAESRVTLELPDGVATLHHTPHPVPWCELEDVANEAWHWPGAEEILRTHRGSVLVNLVGGGADPIARAITLSRLVCAVAAAAPSAAVLWLPGCALQPACRFVERAQAIDRDALPVELWVHLYVEPAGEGAANLLTHGLWALGHMEIEVHHAGGDLWRIVKAVKGTAREILSGDHDPGHGTLIRPGNVPIRVLHGASRWDRAESVMVLVIGA